jgi:prepilin-type N-terminal cleavage/methylation domain-containing protein
MRAIAATVRDRLNRRPRRAFTLIEVVVVLVLIGIFAVMMAIMAGESEGPDYLIRFKSRMLAGKLEEARAASLGKNRLVRLVYDFDMQTMVMYIERRGSEGQPLETDNGDGPPMDAAGSVEFGDPDLGDRDSKIWLEGVQTYNGKTTGRGQLTIDILPEGTSIGHVATLTSKNGEVFAVELNPLTGVARVYDEDHKVAELKKD